MKSKGWFLLKSILTWDPSHRFEIRLVDSQADLPSDSPYGPAVQGEPSAVLVCQICSQVLCVVDDHTDLKAVFTDHMQAEHTP